MRNFFKALLRKKKHTNTAPVEEIKEKPVVKSKKDKKRNLTASAYKRRKTRKTMAKTSRRINRKK